jgi:hypothetical protein
MITESEIKDIFSCQFNDCLQSIRQISWDPVHEAALVDMEERFHHYDIIADKFYDNTPKSPDMILFDNDTIVFVEFKNGKINSKDKDKIKLKAIEGCFIIFHKIITSYKKNVSFLDIFKLKKYYILVYNTERNTRDRIRDRKHSNLARFGLENYKGTFFHNVSTLSRDVFTGWLRTQKFTRYEEEG